MNTEKVWNWSRCTRLALSSSWIHDLMNQLVSASEWNSVAVGLNSKQSKFECHMYQFCYRHIITSSRFWFWGTWRLAKANAELKSEHWTKGGIRVSVQSLLWLWVKLMVLVGESPRGKFSDYGFESHRGQFS